jgi:hypothetical protein
MEDKLLHLLRKNYLAIGGEFAESKVRKVDVGGGMKVAHAGNDVLGAICSDHPEVEVFLLCKSAFGPQRYEVEVVRLPCNSDFGPHIANANFAKTTLVTASAIPQVVTI